MVKKVGEHITIDILGTPGFSSDRINHALWSDYYAAGMTISFILFKDML